MAGYQEQPCPKCGFMLGPFDQACPRCARYAQEKCAECGQPGIAGECESCGKQICAGCGGKHEDRLLCRSCLAVATGGARYVTPAAQAGRPGGPASYRLPSTGYSTGLGSSFSRALVFMREAAGMVFRDGDLIVPAALNIGLSIALIGSFFLALHLANVDMAVFLDEDNPSTAAWVTLAAIGVVGAFIHYFTIGATVSLVASHLRGEDAKIGAALRAAAGQAVPLLVLAVVSTVVHSIARSLRRRHVPIVGGAVEEVWTVASYLAVPVIMLEGASFTQAGQRAYELHRKNLLGIAIGEIGVDLVSQVAFLLLFVPLVLILFWGSFIGQVVAIPLAIGVGVIGVMALATFMMYFRTAYYTCLYLWAAQKEAAGEEAQVPAPAPLAAALGV